MPIRVLDTTVAAQIAAGEVVERPASVIKELLENAIDAGAKRITVEARGGGLRELKIQDDGCGIVADEVELAFERHATSKLRSADDLWSIATLGFRGEALPSIASVAQVICTTRNDADPIGTELRIAGGDIQARTAVGCSRGTTFAVRNLFYNVPVRREFLKSESAEAAAITAVVTQYALAYPEVRFALLLDGRLALQTSGSNNLRDVLIDLYGLDVARQLLPIDASFGTGADAVQVRGMVSPPGITRSSRGYLHVFVNRRAVQPRGQLAYVIEEAYHTLLMKNRHPVAVLDLQVHPGAVDVNIHPTKSEVKFRDTPRVMGALGRAVREALMDSGDVRPWEDAAPPAVEVAQRRFELRQLGSWQDGPRSGGAADLFDLPTTASAPWNAAPAEWGAARVLGADVEAAPHMVQPHADDQAAFSTAPAAPPSRLPPLRILGQVAANYIIAETPDGVYLIDQHAAHERINYERLMALRGTGAVQQQNLLLPQAVELPPVAHQTLLDHRDDLAEWGFVLEDFGACVRVRSVPSGMRDGDLAAALLEIADHLAGRGGSTPHDWREAMLTTLACHTSIRAGQQLSLVEMRELITQLEQCTMPRTCPHGRPTMILLTTTQLERQFGRIK